MKISKNIGKQFWGRPNYKFKLIIPFNRNIYYFVLNNRVVLLMWCGATNLNCVVKKMFMKGCYYLQTKEEDI